MICSRCGKNEATVFYKQVINNKITEAHVCLDCAQGGLSAGVTGASPLLDLLSALGELKTPAPRRKRLECPRCGLKELEFRKSGRLGCSHCYGAFAPQLDSLLERVHGADRHRGKVPAGRRAEPGKKEDRPGLLARLRKELDAAVSAESFEAAARLRDRIERLDRGEEDRCS